MAEDGPSSASGVREGDVLAGKYRVERVLGVGGMGVVVAAHHVQLDTKVAIKFLLPDMLANQEAVGRFAREARAAVRITSEHVARVLDVGTLETGAPYMVMEYLEGGDLAAWLKERGRLAVDQAVEFVLQACVAVADAHALGIVHRDLKPANLFCVRRSDAQLSIKVLDFGISKMTGLSPTGTGAGMSMTRTTVVMGSPLYMSPEQVQSAKSVDARTDIWALGIILFELLTASVPFEAEAFGEIAVKISVHDLPSLRGLRPDIPPGLEAVVRRCLEKDRERRYPNVAELATALLPFAPARARGSVERITGIIRSAGLSSRSLPSPAAGTTTQAAAAGTMSPFGLTGSGGARGKTAGVLGVVGVLAVAAVVAVVVVRPSRKAPEGGAGATPIAATSLSSPAAAPPPAAPPSPASAAAVDAPAATTVALAPAGAPPTVAASSVPKTTAAKATAKPASPAATAIAGKPSSPSPPTAPAAAKAPPPDTSNVDPLSRLRPK